MDEDADTTHLIETEVDESEVRRRARATSPRRGGGAGGGLGAAARQSTSYTFSSGNLGVAGDEEDAKLVASASDGGGSGGVGERSRSSVSSGGNLAAGVHEGEEAIGHVHSRKRGGRGEVRAVRTLDGDGGGGAGAGSAADIDGDDLEPKRLGCFGSYPDWLQRFGTPGWFLVSLCLFTLVQSMVNSGLFPVVVSSLERQYGFTSTQAGWVSSSYDIVSALVAIIITNYGHHSHRPKWLARGMTLLGLGCFVFTAPHWISRLYTPEGTSDADLCVAYAGKRVCTVVQYGYYLLFILAQVIFAIGASPLYTLGSTFVDDNVPPKLNSSYMGIFYSMGAAGPALGYVIGGLFLTLWVDASQTTTLSQNSVGWVGNWWAPFLLAGSLGILLSVPLYMYPKHLPGMEWVLAERRKAKDRQLRRHSKVVTTDDATAPANGAPAVAKEESFVETFKSIVTNKPYIFSQLGFTLEAIVIIGLGTFLPKVVQAQFRTTSSNASFLSGGVVVFGAAGGILTGGLISRRWPMKKLSRNVCFMGFSALLTIPCFLIRCNSLSLAGLNTAYPTYANRTYPTALTTMAGYTSSLMATCNSACDCAATNFKPVCGGGVTYFSACHAGCVQRVSDTVFTNCSCLPSPTLRTADGSCEGACPEVVFFLLGLFVLLFLTFMINVPGTIFCMRVVAEHQRSLALGIGSAIQRIGGAIPGPIILGAILDSGCLLWDKQCDGSNGACWEYDSWSLSRDIFIASFILKSLSSISFFLAWYNYHPASAEEDAAEADLKAREEQASPLELEALEAGGDELGSSGGGVSGGSGKGNAQ